MTSAQQRNYKINIDPRILELLGPSLYTNIYYVLAELIANAYDADAKNVYIIEKADCIIVEDDGNGMSYENGDIERYLDVAVETRTETENVFSLSGTRRRMGRKGVGKLAALSVSKDVLINTRKSGEQSGFILSRHVGKDHQLTALSDENIVFEKISGDGTSIVMTAPQYGLHKTSNAIKKNLLKIFPLVNSKFRIHIITDRETTIIDCFDTEMVSELGGLVVLGEDFHHLKDNFNSALPADQNEKMLFLEDEVIHPLTLTNKAGDEKEYNLEIRGWVGIYRTTRGRKNDPNDFPDNFVSLLSNNKLGEFNILPVAGKNKLNEVFIVGQLHVDLFEDPELHDIALSNRQGYKTDDPRYETVLSYASKTLIPRMANLRTTYSGFTKAEKEVLKIEQQKKQEKELRDKVDNFKKDASRGAADKISDKIAGSDIDNIKEIIASELNALLPMVGLKSKIDQQKKKILISHTGADKALADVVYKMLSFNNVSDSEIIYTSCDNSECRIPEEIDIFDYLKEFFVDSYSTEKIYVIYVTSENMAKSWAALSEVGAGWITQSMHKIFNINNHTPQKPLNVNKTWHSSKITDDLVQVTPISFDDFLVKLIDICNTMGIIPKSKDINAKELSRYVTVYGK